MHANLAKAQQARGQLLPAEKQKIWSWYAIEIKLSKAGVHLMPEYEIYTLRRVLHLKRQISTPVHILAAAVCPVDTFSLIAAACSNGFLVLRYAGASSTNPKVLPAIRFLPWSSVHHRSAGGVCAGEDTKNVRIVDLCFCNSGKILYVLCMCGRVFCIPVFSTFLRFCSSPQTELETSESTYHSFESYTRSTTTATVEKAVYNSETISLLVKEGSGATSIAYWHSFSGSEYVLLGTAAGRVVLIQCDSEHFGQVAFILKVSVAEPVTGLSVVTDPSVHRGWGYALLKTPSRTFRLLLEQSESSSIHSSTKNDRTLCKRYTSLLNSNPTKKNIPRFANGLDFAPSIINTQWKSGIVGSRCSIQSLGPGRGAGIGIQRLSGGNVLEIYAIDAPLPYKFPLFQFQIPQCMFILHTKNILFVISQESEEEGELGPCQNLNVSLYSSLFSAGNIGDCFRDEAKLQSFSIPCGEDWCIYANYAPWTVVSNDEVYLEGIVIITADSVYELRPRSIKVIENLFFDIVNQFDGDDGVKNFRSTHDESLVKGEQYAKSLGLNVLALYEEAAEKVLEMGKYHAPRAMTLFDLSGASKTHILNRLIMSGRPDIAARKAAFLLNFNDEVGIPLHERAGIAILAIRCFLSSNYIGENVVNNIVDAGINELCSAHARILEPSAPSGLLSFLELNSDYDLSLCLRLLYQAGYIGAIFVASHARKDVNLALDVFSKHTSPRLTHLYYTFMIEKGYRMNMVCSSGYNLFWTLSSIRQRQVLFPPLNVSRNKHRRCPFYEFVGIIKPLFFAVESDVSVDSVLACLESSEKIMLNLTVPVDDKGFVLPEICAYLLLRYNARAGSNEQSILMEGRMRDFFSRKALNMRGNHVEYMCAVLQKWLCCALMYEAKCDYKKALILRLRYIRKTLSQRTQKWCQEALVSLISSHILIIPTTERRFRRNSLCAIISLWFLCGYEVVPLELSMLNVLKELGNEVCHSILSPQGGMEYQHFSKSFCFRVSHNQLSPTRQRSLDISHSKCFVRIDSEIKLNLDKKKNESTYFFDTGDVIISERDDTIFLFSCGHAFRRQIYFNEVLPCFKKGLKSLIFSLPATFSVTINEYEKQAISAICPMCLLAHLKDEENLL